MTIASAAWICLLSPLVGALVITLAGGRLSRRGAGYLATASTFVSFGAAVVGFLALLGREPAER
jgi:NADH:ubiquinone oxidoreductase subunit 5 (subunit L)/multisubunit Na+/H+ antiporter MnhA subunit